jgi:hypothetical protein
VSYCFDTSALLDAWIRWYPVDVFPSFWEKMDALVANGQIVSPDEIFAELEKKEDDLHAWVKSRRKMFCALDASTITQVREILAVYPRLVDTQKGRSQADPFVIAVAKIKGLTVVTGENFGTANKPKIPFVCNELGIPSIGIVKFIRENGWNF